MSDEVALRRRVQEGTSIEEPGLQAELADRMRRERLREDVEELMASRLATVDMMEDLLGRRRIEPMTPEQEKIVEEMVAKLSGIMPMLVDRMTWRSGDAARAPIDDLVENGMRAFAEQSKVPPAERFDGLVRAGIIDEHGRVLHLDGEESDDEVPLRELRRQLGLEQ